MKFRLRRGSSKKDDVPYTRVFGRRLVDTVPLVVAVGMRLLQDKFILSEGIFRVSGDNKTIQELRQQFDEGMYTTEEEIKAALLRNNEHTIAGVVKMWFRELPEPLLTFDHYDMFLAAHQVPEDTTRVLLIKKVLRFLPENHLTALRTITEFLHLLTIFEESNRMNAESLAIIFAPNLLRPRGGTLQDLKNDSPHSIGLMRTLIEEYVFLFEQEDKVLEIEKTSERISDFSSVSEATETIRRVTMSLNDLQDVELTPPSTPVKAYEITPIRKSKKRESAAAELEQENTPPTKRRCHTVIEMSSPVAAPLGSPRRALPPLPNSPSYIEKLKRPQHKRSMTVSAFDSVKQIDSPSLERIYFQEITNSPRSPRGALPTPPRRQQNV